MCRDIILGIAANFSVNPDDAPNILPHLREPLTSGPVYPSAPDQDAIRQRAFDLLVRLLRSARDGLRSLEAAHSGKPFNVWLEAEQKKAQSLVRLINDIGSQIYFASGAFDSRRQSQAGDREPLTVEERERFYREAGVVLDELADVGFPSLAHHLLETLEAFISFDPSGVFLRIGRVVQDGRKEGYQYESMAADLMVRLVERYLAEHRTLLRENEECRRTLLEVLDIFVQAGWPSAQRLTYRLEEIFR